MHPCHQDVCCQWAGNGATEMDGKRHSAQLRASITLTLATLSPSLPVFPPSSFSPSHAFYFGCMIGVCDLVPAETCSVNECGLTDGGSWRLRDNSAAGIDGTSGLPLDRADKVKTMVRRRILMIGPHNPLFQLVNPAQAGVYLKGWNVSCHS